jgi:hypothetical protein
LGCDFDIPTGHDRQLPTFCRSADHHHPTVQGYLNGLAALARLQSETAAKLDALLPSSKAFEREL